MRNVLPLCLIVLLLVPASGFAQFYHYNNYTIERKIDSAIAQLSLSEKTLMLNGYRNGRIRGIPSLNIPEINTNSFYFVPKTSTGLHDYPTNLNLAATWDTALVSKLGKITAQQAKAAGIHLLIGPNLNLYRSPLSPENAHHWSEDPFLSAQLSAALIQGIQSQKVMSAPSGYVADYKEYTHAGISLEAEERTMEEMYLYPYRIAVAQGKAAGIVVGKGMWNKPSSLPPTTYITDVLKGEFLFEGMAIANQEKKMNGKIAVQAGIDVELPFGFHLQQDSLTQLVQAGKLSPAFLDDKIRRILRMNLHFMGKNPATNPPSSADWENLGTAIAQNSMVLLKNENNILPLNKTTLSSIAIIGPQSKKYIGWKEGEDYQTSLSFADGIRLAKKETTALYTSNALLSPYENMEKNGYFTNDSLLHSGIYTTYYNDTALSKPLYCKIEPQGNFSLEDNQGLMFTTAVIPEMTGDYTFFLEGSDGLKLEVNQEVLIHQWKDTTHRLVKATLSLKAGEVYQLKGTHYQKNGGTPLRMGYYLLGMGVNYQEAIESAKKSEVAIVCVGYDIPSESDGRAFALPHEQEKLVKDICRVNKNTIVVLTGGGSIDMMSWKDSARAVIHTFYPGCYAGTALANILFGEYNPSARLPFSYERKFSDNPIAPYHQDSNHDKKVVFEEGLRLGYRNYVSDEDAAPPLFPFGFGLSYTSFIYTNLTISPNNYTGEGVVTVSFDVSNVGKVKGTDVPQLYIRDPQASVVRPERELKGWTKVTLNAGETQHLSISLTAEQLAFYRPEHKQWSAENGVFEAQIGKNALDISLKAPFYYSGERVYVRTKRRRK